MAESSNSYPNETQLAIKCTKKYVLLDKSAALWLLSLPCFLSLFWNNVNPTGRNFM